MILKDRLACINYLRESTLYSISTPDSGWATALRRSVVPPPRVLTRTQCRKRGKEALFLINEMRSICHVPYVDFKGVCFIWESRFLSSFVRAALKWTCSRAGESPPPPHPPPSFERTVHFSRRLSQMEFDTKVCTFVQ